MSSHTKSMASRAEGVYERIRGGAIRAHRANLPKWLASLLDDEAERLEELALHVRQIHEADELSRQRTVWDPPQTCPHRERCQSVIPAYQGGA